MCARQPLARSHALTRAYTPRSYAVCRTALAAVAVVVPRARCAVAAPTTRRGRRRVAPSSTAATPARACALPTAPVRLARSLGDPGNLFIHLLARSLSRLLGSAVVPAVVAGAWRAAVHHMLRVLLLLRGAVPLLSIAPCDGIRAQHATQLPRTLGCVACTAPVPPWLTSPRECTTHTHTHTVDKQRALRGPTARSADLRVRTKRQERDGNQLLDQWRCQCPGSARPRER